MFRLLQFICFEAPPAVTTPSSCLAMPSFSNTAASGVVPSLVVLRLSCPALLPVPSAVPCLEATPGRALVPSLIFPILSCPPLRLVSPSVAPFAATPSECERYEHEIDYRLWDIGSSKSL